MTNIDPPWIRETEATGHCSAENGGWWNNPPEYNEDCDDELDEEDDFDEGDDGDVFYGNETSDF